MIALIVAIVTTLSLIGVIVCQQFEISRLYGRNEELTVSNMQKDHEITNLKDDFHRLNSTYFQLLDNLQTIASLLNSSDSKLSLLQQNYSLLLDSYSNLSTKVQTLKNSIAQLSQEFGGYEGIFILNYTYIYTYEYPYHRYYAEIEWYNALESAEVTVKVYGTGGTSKTFTYSMSGYSKRTFVETWDTGLEGGYDFSLITIDDVVR
jgi:hypothetical protein